MSKRLLRENFSKDWNETLIINKLPIVESNNIVESEGKKYKVLEGFEVPVWRLGVKNLNERIYSIRLAEKVVKDFGKLSTANLTDHPKEEGSVSNIVSVARNPHIKEGILYVDSFIVDENFGKKLARMHEVGFSLGVSSSCYGDLDEATGNVLEEGFEVDRFFDWVIQPSYSVYVGPEHKRTYNESEISEGANYAHKVDLDADTVGTTYTTSSTANSTVYTYTIPATNTLIENKEIDTMSTKLTSLEEKNLKLGIKNLFEKADAKVDLKEKVSAYNEILEYCEGVEFAAEYVEQANSKIATINEEIHVLAEKGKLVEGLSAEKASLEEKASTVEKDLTASKTSLDETSTKLEKAIGMLDTFKTRELKLKEMYEIAIAEKNGMIEAEEYKNLSEKYDELELKLDELLTENNTLAKKVKSYKKIILRLEAEEKEDENDSEDDDSAEDKKKAFFASKKEAARKARRVEADIDANEGDETKESDVNDEDNDGDKTEPKGEVRNRRSYDNSSLRENEEDDYDLTEGNEIRQFMIELLEQNPNNRKIKNQILKCKTLFEAQKTYLDLMDFVEKDPSVYKPRLSETSRTYGGVQVSNEQPRNNLVRKGWE